MYKNINEELQKAQEQKLDLFRIYVMQVNLIHLLLVQMVLFKSVH